MTVFERLREDHDKQRTLLDLVAKTQGASDGRDELFAKLKTELLAHAAAEEQVFYAQLMAHQHGTDIARHSVAEHKEMNDQLEALSQMSLSNPNWIRKFSSLKEAVEHHLEEEEREVFQIAGKHIDEDTLADMQTEFESRKTAEMTAQ